MADDRTRRIVLSVADIASHARLNLSESELATVSSVVLSTGNYAPEAEVVALFQEGKLSRGSLTFFLPWLWRYRADSSPVPSHVWRAMFDHAEYTEDCVVRARPRRTFLAYRGATAENREGLSWSLDADQAKYFARARQAPDALARVWVTNIPPSRLFARFSGIEKEITADVRGLDIRPIEHERALPRPHSRPWWPR